MRRQARILFSILGLMIAAGLVLATPVARQVRSLAWDWWVTSLAQVASIGRLHVTPDVADQLYYLRAENVRLSAQVRRFERLERQLGEPTYTDFKPLPAIVAARAVDTFQTEYFLNRGTADGVQAGAPVVTAGSVLVGFITDLSAHSSVMRLLFHPSTNVPVEIMGADLASGPIQGLAQGRRFTSVVLTTVPRDRKLTRGNPIVTAAQDSQLPYGLVIGSVGRIRSTEHDAYQETTIDLPYDPGALEAVTILHRL